MERTWLETGRHAMMASYLRLPCLRLARPFLRSQQRQHLHVVPRMLARASQAAPRQERRAHTEEAAGEFFAKQADSFASLGLEPSICAALKEAGFDRPAHVQELALPAILERKDVVLAAETGSGKTLAYLTALIQLVQANRAASQAAAARLAAEGHRGLHHTAALVLCPNSTLCEQVLSVARSLVDPATGLPLATSALVSSASPPPPEMPHLVVSTPGALVSMMDNVGPAFGFEWTRAGLPLWARQVVFDEADLLLAGAYERHMRIIMDLLRLGDRESRMRRVCREVGIAEEEFKALPRHLKHAGLAGGAKALFEAGYNPLSPAASSAPAQPSSSSSNGDGGDGGGTAADSPAGGSAAAGGVAGSTSGPLWRRQYVFVAATMPVEGGTTVGNQIERHFPSAVWLAGERLHRGQAAVAHAWREVGAEGAPSRGEVLKEVVSSDSLLSKGRGRMLVFARDVASANATAEALRGVGPPVLLFHREVPQAERSSALVRLAKEEGLLMVCTDAAARGLDVPSISHVVQADFALSAIDFLHRVGRTARAGRTGQVTSLYGPENADLVAVIKAALEAGEPVEGAFSRKRSFRKKLKRYGQYVPRGAKGPAPAQQGEAAAKQEQQQQQAQQQRPQAKQEQQQRPRVKQEQQAPRRGRQLRRLTHR